MIARLFSTIQPNDMLILYEKGEETKKKFALDEETIESIFDLLEEEHPEL